MGLIRMCINGLGQIYEWWSEAERSARTQAAVEAAATTAAEVPIGRPYPVPDPILRPKNFTVPRKDDDVEDGFTYLSIEEFLAVLEADAEGA